MCTDLTPSPGMLSLLSTRPLTRAWTPPPCCSIMKSSAVLATLAMATATGSKVSFEVSDGADCVLAYTSSATGLVTACDLTAPNLCLSDGTNCQATDLSSHATKTELDNKFDSVQLTLANLNRMVSVPLTPSAPHGRSHAIVCTVPACRPAHTTLARTISITRMDSAHMPMKARARSVRAEHLRALG
jgi:hypothetical protein